MNKLPPAYVSPMSKRSARGQSLVEFALTLPILLLILVGVLDLGRVYFASVTITNAAREGARYGASNPTNTSGIQTRVINEAAGSLTLTASNITISKPNGSDGGNLVTVTVSYNFGLITTYLFAGAPTVPLQTSATMMIN